MKVDDIFYRIYQPIHRNNNDENNKSIDLDENDVRNAFDQANFINNNENMQLTSEDNYDDENTDIQSNVSLQNEIQDNHSDSNSNSEDNSRDNENVLIVNEDDKEQLSY